jgi:fucose 4-O-acetylase-like acetyltransferase
MSSRIALFFSLFYYLFNNENRVSLFLSDIGRYTLVIYVLQVVIIEYTLNRFHFYETANSAVFNFIVSPSIAAVIVLASFGIGKLTHKCPKLELVLFGRYY